MPPLAAEPSAGPPPPGVLVVPVPSRSPPVPRPGAGPAVDWPAAELVPVELVPVELVPVELVPVLPVLPVEPVPVEVLPVELVPVELVPVELVPVEVLPVELVPVELVPVELVPVELVPVLPALPVLPVELVPVEVAPAEVPEEEGTVPDELVGVPEVPDVALPLCVIDVNVAAGADAVASTGRSADGRAGPPVSRLWATGPVSMPRLRAAPAAPASCTTRVARIVGRLPPGARRRLSGRGRGE